MDKKIKEYKLENGTIISINAVVEGSEINRVSKKEEKIKSFEDSISVIKPVSEALLATLKDLNTPDEIQLEFGITLGTKAGVIFVSADAEASFKVSIKWSNKK